MNANARTRLWGTSLLAAGLLTVVPAASTAQAAVVVDNFTQGQFSLVDTTAFSGAESDTDGGLATTNAIGGVRLTELRLNSGSQTSAALSTGTDGGVVAFSVAPASEGQLTLSYSANAPYNLAAGGDRFRVAIGGGTVSGTLAVFVTSGGSTFLGRGVDYSAAGAYDVPFSSFQPFIGSGTPNFAGIESIGVNLTSTAGATPLSYTVRDVSVVVPEPASASLTGCAAASLLLARRRRRR